MEIVLPKGSKALNMESFGRSDTNHYGDSETELLLQKNTTFRVVKDGRWTNGVITVEIVSDG